MKRLTAILTAAAFVPLMSCRTTDSNLASIDNAARAEGTPLSQNVCGADMPTKPAEREEREKWYELWFANTGANAAIQVQAQEAAHQDVLVSEVKHTLNAIPMNLLLAFFNSGGRIVANNSSRDVCASKIQGYAPEKVMFALEDAAPLESQTSNELGQIQRPGEGPQSRLPQVRSCWVSIPGKSGVEIHIGNEVVNDSEKSLRDDGLIASSVRHGTVRIFAFILSELIAHTYLDPEKRTLEGTEEEMRKTLATKIDLQNNAKPAGFVPSAPEMQFGQIDDPKNPGKKINGIQIPVNKEFMQKLDGMFDRLNDDVLQSEGRYTLHHYREWTDPNTGKALPKYRNVLNHFAFADGLDSQLCNDATRSKLKDFTQISADMSEIETALKQIEIADGPQTGMITTDRAYLLASTGGWQGDLYYGVFGETLKTSGSNQVESRPMIAWIFGRIFRWVGRAIARTVSFVWHNVVRPVARFAVNTVAYAANGVLYTAGLVAGTATSIVAPRWTAYRSSIGGGIGPFSRGFREAGRYWTWHGAHYA